MAAKRVWLPGISLVWGHTEYDPSSEPGRWQSYTISTDLDQTRSEWVDMDMEMEALIHNAYDSVTALLQRNR
eukprot:364885-Chlamydomonas_euryale.AAC.5